MITIRDLIEFRAPSRVRRDEATGAIVLEGCKLLGARSSNVNPDGTHNVYPLETRRAALSLYEGAKVFVDHPPREQPGIERSVSEQLGRVRGAAARDDGNYGDVVLNPKHPLAESVAWDAEHSPDSLAFSHNAVGVGRVEGGDCVIESITRVRSTDLVVAGATTRGLFEGRKEGDVDRKQLLLDALAPIVEGIDGLVSTELVEMIDEAKLIDILAEDVTFSGDKIAKALAFIARSALAEKKAATATEGSSERDVAELERSLAATRAELAEIKAASVASARAAARDKLLAESRLPPAVITDLFRAQVLEAQDDARARALIEDRKRIAFHETPRASVAAETDTTITRDALVAAL